MHGAAERQVDRRSAADSTASAADSTAFTGVAGTRSPSLDAAAPPPCQRCPTRTASDDREERGVGVRDPRHLQAGPSSSADRLATVWRRTSLVKAPWPPRRCSNAAVVISSVPPGLQHARHLARRCPRDVVGQAVEHVERGDDVEGRIRERNRGDAGARYRGLALLGARTRGRGRSGRSRRPGRDAAAARGWRRCRSRSRAAAGRAAGGGLRQPRPDEAAESPEPEVRAFGAVGELEQAVHAARATRAGPSRWRRHGTIRDLMRPSRADGSRRRRCRAPSSSPPPSPIRSFPSSIASAASTPTMDAGASGSWPGWRESLIDRPAQPLRRQHLLSGAQRARLLRGQPRRRCAGAPAWGLTGNPYLAHNIVVLVAFVMAVAGAYYLVRYLTGSREAAAVARRSCSASARSSSRAPRTSSC